VKDAVAFLVGFHERLYRALYLIVGNSAPAFVAHRKDVSGFGTALSLAHSKRLGGTVARCVRK
jgi:hypothetical protein